MGIRETAVQLHQMFQPFANSEHAASAIRFLAMRTSNIFFIKQKKILQSLQPALASQTVFTVIRVAASAQVGKEDFFLKERQTQILHVCGFV